MNCDQAFEFITDINLRDQDELHVHLGQCSRCKDLAEALDPAIDLFADSTLDPFEHPYGLAHEAVEQSPSARTTPAGLTGGESRVQENDRRQTAPWLTAQRQQHRRSARQDGAKVAVLLLFIAAITAAFAAIGRDESNGRLLSSSEPCVRGGERHHQNSNTLVAQCVACHVELIQNGDLDERQKAESDRAVTACVACHLKAPSNNEAPKADLLQACLFPIQKS